MWSIAASTILTTARTSRSINHINHIDTVTLKLNHTISFHQHQPFFILAFMPFMVRTREPHTRQDALKAESEFFAANYASLSHRCGVPFLSRTLSKVLMLHIRKCLPDLKQRIRGLLVWCYHISYSDMECQTRVKRGWWCGLWTVWVVRVVWTV